MKYLVFVAIALVAGTIVGALGLPSWIGGRGYRCAACRPRYLSPRGFERAENRGSGWLTRAPTLFRSKQIEGIN